MRKARKKKKKIMNDQKKRTCTIRLEITRYKIINNREKRGKTHIYEQYIYNKK